MEQKAVQRWGSLASALPATEVDWLRWTVSLAFAITLLLTPQLWLTTRDYPLNPVWSGLPPLPPPWDRALLGLALATLALIAVSPSPRRPIGVFCGIAACVRRHRYR